jgi:type IX secretion system PorP/SprF family membrane protein
MKKTLTTIALSITVLLASAQQDAQFSMNMFNRLSMNPAYAGMNKALCATMLYRQQWTGFPGAPKTGLLSVDYGQILRGGVGLTVDQDQLAGGGIKTLSAKLAYSYHLPLGPGTLGIGLNGGLMQKSINVNFIAPEGGSTGNGGIGSNGFDPSVPWNKTSSTTYDVGFGLYYQTRKLYVGLSSLHLPEQQFTSSGFAPISKNNWDLKYKEARHYYVMAGYTFIPAPAWEITPSMLLKSVASSSQLDVNLMAKWNKMIFGGMSYRISDAIVAIIGLERPFGTRMTAKFGYSYDMTTSKIATYSNGTHEIMLGFCYKIKPDATRTSHMNVRFL